MFFLGLLATSLGFVVTVTAVNMVGSAVGLFDFDPSYRSRIERKYPRVTIGLSIVAMIAAGSCMAALGVLKWFLLGTAIFPLMMVLALLYFQLSDRG